MATYRVTLQTVASVTYTVTADDEDTAIYKAMEQAPNKAYGTGGAIQNEPLDLSKWGVRNFSVDYDRRETVELLSDTSGGTE